jgi:hypothetical protein
VLKDAKVAMDKWEEELAVAPCVPLMKEIVIESKINMAQMEKHVTMLEKLFPETFAGARVKLDQAKETLAKEVVEVVNTEIRTKKLEACVDEVKENISLWKAMLAVVRKQGDGAERTK